eukprot:gnl/Dysnectes_brevis/2158_a2511_2052.p1 GENE.gnl/Dysnectes_brevis/2158_a2511_2052~~gnl/Dysnectes_brevis/2158_a2511_2052.p1  ORF type:complete len:226 (+),score=36.86 gnl/Dysnectes_brevis/2158_a2511_2052:95-772(+)
MEMLLAALLLITAAMSQLQIKTFPIGPLQANCFVVWDSVSKQGAIIDPGHPEKRVVDFVRKQDISIQYILATHAHFDHIFGSGFFKQAFEVPIYCHEDDRDLWPANKQMASMFGLDVPSSFPNRPDQTFKEGHQFSLGSLTLQVIHTPGHSPGSVVFVQDKQAFVGDTVFAMGVGRTDLPGGSGAELKKSLKKLWKKLSADTTIYPGHGGTAKSGQAERSSSMFV